MTPSRSFIAAAALLAVALAVAALAQSPVSTIPAANAPASALPAFAVVSVRPFRPTGPWHRPAQFDPQRLYIEGMAPVELINLAYSLNGNQLAGLPAWAEFSKDHLYSITGVTGQPTSQAQMLLMLRRVLAERFQLVLSESNKVQPVFFLEVAPGGPKLTPLKPGEDCQTALRALPRSTLYETLVFRACNIPDLVTRLNTFAKWLVPLPVIDKTGLTGNYVMGVRLKLSDVTPIMVNGKQRGEKIGHQESVVDALPRELGLALVKTRAPYRMLNVVHLAPPSPNN